MGFVTTLLLGAATGVAGTWVYLRRQQEGQDKPGPAPAQTETQAPEMSEVEAQAATDDSSD